MSLEVRRLRSDDLDVLRRRLPAWHPDEYARRLRAQDRGELVQSVAWDGDMPIGRGHVLFPSHEEWSISALRDGCAEIRDVGVAASHRRRGVGRALIASLEEAARIAGLGRIGLAVDVDELPARALYTGLGYAQSHGPFVISTTLDTGGGPLAVAGVVVYLTKAC